MRGPILAGVSVAVPVYNEEDNLPALLDFLLSEGVAGILVADDGSRDASPAIAAEYARRFPHVASLQTGGRMGPLGGWRIAVDRANTPVVVLVDADTRPLPGAIELLASTVTDGSDCVISSGRVVPANDLRGYPAGRFRAEALHRLRALQFVRDAVIGRFAAVQREWFAGAVTESSIVACDAYLGCLAAIGGHRVRYVPEAVCMYAEVTSTADFASQRQRADAGYRQLRAMGLLLPEHEPGMGATLRAVAGAARDDVPGALAWGVQQLKSKFVRAYDAGDSGSWEALHATKQRI